MWPSPQPTCQMRATAGTSSAVALRIEHEADPASTACIDAPLLCGRRRWRRAWQLTLRLDETPRQVVDHFRVFSRCRDVSRAKQLLSAPFEQVADARFYRRHREIALARLFLRNDKDDAVGASGADDFD